MATKNKRILDLIHSYVWKTLILFLGEAKYFTSFINDYSKRLWVCPIKKKSDVFLVFKEFKARVELEIRKRIISA